MTARQLTQVYLAPGQKKALQARAEEQGTKVSEEIRRAIDAYLSGITTEELEMLDMVSRSAEKEISAMAAQLDATNKKLDKVFNQLDRIHTERDEAA